MATGDLKGNLRRIEQGLRLLNYSKDVDYNGLAKGDPAAFLPIISYCFTSFSTHIMELLVELDVELMAKNDLRFIESIYKLLRDHFQYKPVLTKQQFLQYGFAERKMQIVCEIINMVYKKHKEFSNVNKVKSQPRKKIHVVKHVPEASISDIDSVFVDAVDFQPKLQIERHSSAINVCCSKDAVNEVLHEETDASNIQEELLRNYDDQMKELKSQLAELQEKVNKLKWVEEKVYVLEEKLQGKVIIDERDWNNLLSRVVLLETQLIQQPKKDKEDSAVVRSLAEVGAKCASTIDLSTECNHMNEENASGIRMTPVSPDKEKEELPESLHHSSGYSSLISSDPSPKAMVVNNHDLSKLSKETTIQRMERISKMIEETSELLKTSSSTS